MMDFLKKLFGAAPTSSSTAKERLRLVLMTDHLALAPEIIDQMKRDLVDVISRYVEVDREKVEVNFEREDKALAMLANIPIKAVNRPPGGEPSKPQDAPGAQAPAQTAVAPVAPAVMSAPRVASPGAEAATGGGAPPQRRRRKRKGPGPSAATTPPAPRTSPAF